MADIFNRVTDVFGGSFASDSARLTFPALAGGGSEVGMLVQNMTSRYTQMVNRLYELGSNAVYYVSGRTSGDMSVARIVGPRKISAAFYQTYGDVCRARSNSLHFSMVTGCGDQLNERASFTLHFVVINSVTVGMTAGDMLINESLAAMFSSFLYN